MELHILWCFWFTHSACLFWRKSTEHQLLLWFSSKTLQLHGMVWSILCNFLSRRFEKRKLAYCMSASVFGYWSQPLNILSCDCHVVQFHSDVTHNYQIKDCECHCTLMCLTEQVSPPDDVLEWKELTDKAANKAFFIELFKGENWDYFPKQ